MRRERKMASLRKTDSGKWEVEVVIGRDPATGKKKRKSKRFRLLKDSGDPPDNIKITHL